MSTHNKQLQRRDEESIDIWNNKKADKIRKLFAPNLTNEEFAFFWGLGKSLEANPFTREIWAVKYDKGKPAQIFLGRDFYRKKAQEQTDYNGHVVDAVYANDDFRVENGQPKHSYQLEERGKLLGAYCTVYKKGIDNPFYVYVEIGEYHKGQSTWNEKPATMIKKVAEAQALRGAYQGIFRGTYDESEQWEVQVEQPTDRETIDISEPEADSSTTEIEGLGYDEELLAKVNELGKKVFGGISAWARESKAMIANYEEEAEDLTQVGNEGLKHIKNQLEYKLEKQSASQPDREEA